MMIVDVSDPANMVELSSIPTGGFALGLDVVDTLAYVPTTGTSMAIVDVADPSAPVEVGRYTSPATWFHSYDVVVQDGIAVLVSGDYSIDVVDVSDPTNPFRVAEIDESLGGYEVVRNGNHVYVADAETSFRVLDVSTPEFTSVVGRHQGMGYVRGVVVDGTLTYAGDVDGHIWTIGLTDPLGPAILSQERVWYGRASAVCVHDTVLVVGTSDFWWDSPWGGIELFGIVAPDSLTRGAHITGIETAVDVDADGDYVFALGTNAGVGQMVIYDISSGAPVQRSKTAITFGVRTIEPDGDHAYVAAGTYGLKVYDVSDRANPGLLTTYGAGGSFDDVIVAGNLAYVAVPDTGLLVMDVSVPSSPTVISRLIGAARPTRLAYSFPYLLSASQLDTLLLAIDITDPFAPSIVTTFESGETRELAVDGTTIARTDGTGSLELLRANFLRTPTGMHSVASPLVLRQNYPNPFNPYTTITYSLSLGSHVIVRIYDVKGRFVRTLVDGFRAADVHREVWDGRNAHSEPVASGVYFYRLTAGGFTMTKKMVLLK
jgi:hypothetical protein